MPRWRCCVGPSSGRVAQSGARCAYADLHRPYDAGQVASRVTITPDHEFRVSPALRDEYANGRIYYDLEHTLRAHRATIRLPANPAHRPDRDRLAWHAGVAFRG